MVSSFQLTRSTRLTLTHPTEPNAEAVGPVTRVDIAAPTEPNPESPIEWNRARSWEPESRTSPQVIVDKRVANTVFSNFDAQIGTDISCGV